ncbi:MAG: exonuclease domain-containing protein [Sphingobacteriales bacterium JAD_PAG50586_3]|nr:MAG: exonuclease domain-containing protein [Sphingobacteriales bacterium JAD_PAG50586_3]
MNFIAIDFETANSNRGSICSMGVAVVQQGVLVGTDHFYIKPTPNFYDFRNVIIHGIDDSKTRHLQTFQQQWPNLRKYFNNQTIIAHNAAFDCSVLRFTLDYRHNCPTPTLTTIVRIDWHRHRYRCAAIGLTMYRATLTLGLNTTMQKAMQGHQP